MPVPDVTVTEEPMPVEDTDAAEVTIDPRRLLETGAAGTYLVALTTVPSGPVTATVSNTNALINSAPTALIFDASNHAAVQAVTVSHAVSGDPGVRSGPGVVVTES